MQMISDLLSRKGSIFNNFTLKLLSLALGIILWLFASGQQKMELGLIATLRFDNMPPTLMMVNEPEGTLDVRVVGPRTLLFKIAGERLVYPIDLSNMEAGQTSFPIQPDRLRLPKGVRVTRVNPSNVTVVLDEVISKEVPVRVELVGKPAEGYQVGKVEATPHRVTLRGSKNAVLPISHLSTEPISVIDAKGTVEREVHLSIPRIALQSVSHTTVKAQVEIVPAEPEEKIEERKGGEEGPHPEPELDLSLESEPEIQREEVP